MGSGQGGVGVTANNDNNKGLGVAWHGVAWCGVAWCGVACVVWCGVVWVDCLGHADRVMTTTTSTMAMMHVYSRKSVLMCDVLMCDV